MEKEALIRAFWQAVAAQDEAALRAFFAPDARVRWPNTNEQFTVDEYVLANCKYPGQWHGEVERIEQAGDATISVAHVWLADHSASFHAVSFFTFHGALIASLDEYWGDDGEPPEWRRELHIGSILSAR